jgi:low affinity Fe/Cu permease
MLTESWALVIAAGVAAVGGITVALIQQFRKENRRDHGIVMDALQRVSHTMDRVEGKVDSHIDWHLKEAANGRVIRGSKSRGRKAS